MILEGLNLNPGGLAEETGLFCEDEKLDYHRIQAYRIARGDLLRALIAF